MNFVLGLAVGGAVGWYLGRRKMEWQIADQAALLARAHAGLPALPAHAAHGYFTGVKAQKPGPPPPPAPGECPYDMMWDTVLQTCVPVMPWPIQQ